MATLVTGLGYIGSALAERLLAAGEEVVGLENFFSTPREPIEKLVQRGLRLIDGSITDPAAVERALTVASIESVFHLAAQASTHPDAGASSYTQETNYTGHRVLLNACVAHGVRRVIFASSMRIYRLPLPRRITEASPVGPPDLVHLSHLYGEFLLAAYRARGISGVAARIGIVHGVGPVTKTDERFLAVPQRFCLQAALGEPLHAATGAASQLAFVHIADAVQGLIRLRDAPADIAVANVACEVLSIAEVAQAVQDAGRARGLDVRIAYDGRPSPARPRVIETALTGYRAHQRIADGVGAVLDNYLVRHSPNC